MGCLSVQCSRVVDELEYIGMHIRSPVYSMATGAGAGALHGVLSLTYDVSGVSICPGLCLAYLGIP